ncbi:MAG TPA: hypothetical protein PK467_12130 [Candidatus Wallbacteria bacterium]|nr:hypothetical protein [Candidatus Wallbacteria bacterium]
MLKFRFLVFSLLIIFLSSSQCFANICEEDAAKIAMSHCYKNFSELYESPSVKVRVEKVEYVKINGINGMVEFFHVVISKYHRQTQIKINDFLLYEIEKQNASITALKNIENDQMSLKNRAYSLFASSDLASAKSVDYEKYANVIYVFGDSILSGVREEKITHVKETALNNIATVISGIELYKPELNYKISGFESGLNTIKLMK